MFPQHQHVVDHLWRHVAGLFQPELQSLVADVRQRLFDCGDVFLALLGSQQRHRTDFVRGRQFLWGFSAESVDIRTVRSQQVHDRLGGTSFR